MQCVGRRSVTVVSRDITAEASVASARGEILTFDLLPLPQFSWEKQSWHIEMAQRVTVTHGLGNQTTHVKCLFMNLIKETLNVWKGCVMWISG